MHHILDHSVILGLSSAVFLVLSLAVRLIARCMHLRCRPVRMGSVVTAIGIAGLAGALGQLLFAYLYAHLPPPGVLLARAISSSVAGLLLGLAAARVTPYMEPRLAGIYGMVSGAAAGYAFQLLLESNIPEPLARTTYLLIAACAISLAVILPLPDRPCEAQEGVGTAECWTCPLLWGGWLATPSTLPTPGDISLPPLVYSPVPQPRPQLEAQMPVLPPEEPDCGKKEGTT